MDHDPGDHELRASLSNLSEWMTNLPDYATDKPILNLAIPGSHDSGAYWIDPSTPVAPGKFFGSIY